MLCVYGAVCTAPLLVLQLTSYSGRVSDALRSTMEAGGQRSFAALEASALETFYEASTILFSSQPGADRLVPRGETASVWPPPPAGWLVRLPGLLLLVIFFILLREYPAGYLRTLAILTPAIPLVIVPVISYFSGLRFGYSMDRFCEPYWILLDLVILFLLSNKSGRSTVLTANLRRTLVVLMSYPADSFSVDSDSGSQNHVGHRAFAALPGRRSVALCTRSRRNSARRVLTGESAAFSRDLTTWLCRRCTATLCLARTSCSSQAIGCASCR